MDRNEYDIYNQLSGLFCNIQKGPGSAVLKELYDFLKKFPKVAPFNLALVSAQRPGAGYFTNRREWKKFGRSIKPEARPMIILVPFGPVEFVYDISDTVGQDLPPGVENPFRVLTPFYESEYFKFVKQMANAGIKYAEGNYGSQMAGFVTWLPKSEIVRIGKTKEMRLMFQVTVNSNLSRAEQFATMAHELGHLFCGHIGTVDTNKWPKRTTLTLNQREFEAESVCWLVCERRGITNPSADYLRGYLDGGKDIPPIDVGAILRAVTNIESMMHGCFRPLQALLIEEKPKPVANRP